MEQAFERMVSAHLDEIGERLARIEEAVQLPEGEPGTTPERPGQAPS